MQESEFVQHPLWKTVENLSQAMNRLEQSEKPVPLPEFDRIRWILLQLKKFRSVDSRFFVAEQLSTAERIWREVADYVYSYGSASQDVHVFKAVEAAESWLQSSGSWHRPATSNNALAKQAKEDYEELHERFELTVSQLRDLLEEERQRSVKQARETSAILEKFERSASVTNDDVESALVALKADRRSLEQAITNHEETFRSAQADRDATFNKWLEAQGQELYEQANPHLDRLVEAETSATTVLERVRSLGDQTDAAAGQTTGHILAEKFETSSKAELKSGNNTFHVGIGVAMAGVSWLVYVALVTFGDKSDFNWNWLSLKISLALALGGVATILIRKGQQSIATARNYKRTELELRAIGPFLSDIETRSMAEEAKVDFLKRTFGRTEVNSQGEDTSQLLGAKALDVLSAAVERMPAIKP